MSTVVTFELKPKDDTEVVLKMVTEMWQRASEYNKVEMLINTRNNNTMYVFKYYYYEKEEEAAIRSIAEYLISISSDGRLYYYRELAASKDYKRPITIDEIFTKKFKPGDHSGMHWRYQIKMKEA